MRRSRGTHAESEFADEVLAADAPTGRGAAALDVSEPWKPEMLEIRSLDQSELERFQSRWLAQVRAQLLVNPVVAAGNADLLIQELMRARGYPVDPLDWHLGHLSADQAQVVRSFH